MKFGEKPTVASRAAMASKRFKNALAKDITPPPKVKIKPIIKRANGGTIGVKITKDF